MNSADSPSSSWLADWRQRFSGAIPGLDGVRAIAVLMVIAGHFGFSSVNGSLGVMMFFVLSGFLITWLMLRETEETGTVSLSRFYKRRALRIFPAFYAFWVIAVGIYIVRGHELHWGQAISAFFYFSNYYMALVPTGDAPFGHTWSLSIEEQFYLLWPLLFLLGMRQPKCLLRIVVAAILFLWLYRAIAFLVFDVPGKYIYRAFDTRADHLAVGCLLALMLKRGLLDGLVQRLTSSATFPAITILALLWTQTLHDSEAFAYVVGYAVEPLLIAIFLLQVVWFSDKGIWRILNNPVVNFLGRISYPLYLWQQLTLYTAKRLTADFPVFIQFAFALAVTIAFATASYFIIERPFLRSKARYQSLSTVTP